MTIDLDLLIKAYASGIFPMADARDDPETFWVEPKSRAIIPLERLRMSRSLRKTIRSDRFRVTADTAFADVIAICAEQAGDRRETWINTEIEEAFNQLHRLGYAHSVECWLPDEATGQEKLVWQSVAPFAGKACFRDHVTLRRSPWHGLWPGLKSAGSRCLIASL